MQHLMIDIETLAKTPDSVILSLGAVKFNPYSMDDPTDGLYFRIDVDEQIELGRVVDDSTLKWWSTQPNDVRDDAFSDDDRLSLDEVRRHLNKMVVGIEAVWAQGTVFDIGILENLYRQKNWPKPWQFWQIRDSRTLLNTFGDNRELNKKGSHNAFMDAWEQAKAVQTIYNKFNIQKCK